MYPSSYSDIQQNPLILKGSFKQHTMETDFRIIGKLYENGGFLIS